MGCLHSKKAHLRSPDHPTLPNIPEPVIEDQVDQESYFTEFKQFDLSELKRITNGFSPSFIISEGGEKAPNVVYKGKLRGNRTVAIKRFSREAWPNAQQFVAEATGVGKLRFSRLVSLIGCCVEGDERLLVAEYMPNDTLSKHLFHWDNQPLPWEKRVRVADYIAQALGYCNIKNRKIYHDLNEYRVLFDEEGDPRLSSFGLMKNSRDGRSYSTNLAYTPPEWLQTGRIIPESVIFSYGTILLDLLSGKHIPPSQALDVINERKALVLMDSSLEGLFENEEATKLFVLASKCIQSEPKDRPDIKYLISSMSQLQKPIEVESHGMMGLPQNAYPLPTPLSPFGKACSKMDLAAVHEILVRAGYRDEEEAQNELSFQDWTQPVQEMLHLWKFGDIAFKDKDFKSAIQCYSKFVMMMISVPTATIFARRSFCYLVMDQHDHALRDAMQAQVYVAEWPTAFYLQALALWKLHMDTDANDMLKHATELEAKQRQQQNN